MPSRPQFNLPVRSRRSGSGWHWLWLLAGTGFLGWVLWHTSTPSTPPSQSHPPTAQQRVHVPAPPTPPPPPVPLPPAPSETTNAPVALPLTKTNLPKSDPAPAPRRAHNVFEAQLALARLGISCGSLDGVAGSQTRAALRAFQKQEGLPTTGDLDASTKARLSFSGPALANYTLTTNDVARLQPLSTTWLGKSQQTALDYETLLELVAEKFRAHPAFLRSLNPGLDWNQVASGTTVQVPKITPPTTRGKAAFITIHLQDKTLDAFDSTTNLLAHFPCSIAKRVEKRPVGELRVEVIAPNPNYTFNPEVFPESAEARELHRKLVLPPGPNNPVGTAWIGLNRPGYGIHGTPRPEEVGRTESHGCFRLANWDAEFLIRLVSLGTLVRVEP